MRKKNKTLDKFFSYLIIVIIGLVLLYPIIYMFFGTFKSNEEIFGSTKLLPESFSLVNYIEGWTGTAMSYTKYFANTALMVIPTTLLTVASSAFVAYGFARFRFPGKKILFGVLVATLMLPNSVLIVPRYLLYNQFGWLDSYMPFYVQALFACNSFFVYQIVQFMRGLPKDLDESAYIDGCGTFRVFWQILLPLMKPAIFSAGLFQFMWTYNDYFNPLIYLNSTNKYVISLALRSTLDAESVVVWGKVLAMAFVAVIPLVILFFAAQKYFVEGIATSGMKG
ncbi:MAG TPA: carbohydrate ABC transporter permease [Candidatus Limivivens intestinipullorum]|uniref:Carbohydrate ABC transporter permease n=1 Tax=Candidatus Limivivens intestinipullorum TaxID=2840858 RepID=A0A9D1EQH6_9FIRM|nr:carbohydrate ABC transporter permease [Candidatus Limivivens intestinipullorum]